MKLAHLCVDISRDVDSSGGRKVGVSHLLRVWAIQLLHLHAAVIITIIDIIVNVIDVLKGKLWCRQYVVDSSQ